ncbi:hypothetical protein SAMN05519103_04006 [Rhizobiales bacterium GAS113]|nr:hypothetical protein SAMN05519103_04006 [Rhizobiales bacterium GAS113]
MSSALAYFDGKRGYLTVLDEDDLLTQITTTPAHPGRIIHIDDGRQYPALCYGGKRAGSVLTWSPDAATMGELFARDCHAKLYMTRASYNRAVAKARAD